MKNIFIVAEGVSEEHFAKKILCPHFLDFDKNIIPITVLTKKDNRHGAIHKGGITTYRKFQNTLHPILKQAAKSGDSYVTTMVDKKATNKFFCPTSSYTNLKHYYSLT